MLVEFETCGDCECPTCLKNHACPKTDLIDEPCIDCIGVPPYAPFDVDEINLHEFDCNEKKPSIYTIE